MSDKDRMKLIARERPNGTQS